MPDLGRGHRELGRHEGRVCTDECSVMMGRRQSEDYMDAPFRAESHPDRIALGMEFPLNLLEPADAGFHLDQDHAQR